MAPKIFSFFFWQLHQRSRANTNVLLKNISANVHTIGVDGKKSKHKSLWDSCLTKIWPLKWGPMWTWYLILLAMADFVGPHLAAFCRICPCMDQGFEAFLKFFRVHGEPGARRNHAHVGFIGVWRPREREKVKKK